MKLNRVLFITAAAVICVLCLMLKIKDKRIASLSAQTQTLEGDIQRQIRFERGRIIYKYRACKTQQSAQVKEYFVPREGSAEITQKFDNAEPVIKVRDTGLTLAPFAGAAADIKGGFAPYIGLRVFYFRRWGLGGALLPQGPAIALDRRLDDVLPFDNIALSVLAGRRSYAGISVYF